MFVVHGTRKFLDRAVATAPPSESSTTKLGSWYATVLFWKRQIALFVNETTLLPVLIPLAPAASVVDRFPAALAVILEAHRINRSFIDREVAEMTEHRLAKTVNRSVVGVMSEFARLGAAYQSAHAGRGGVVAAIGRDSVRAAVPPPRQPRPRTRGVHNTASERPSSGLTDPIARLVNRILY